MRAAIVAAVLAPLLMCACSPWFGPDEGDAPRENQATIWYVDERAPPGGDGASWATAFTHPSVLVGSGNGEIEGESKHVVLGASRAILDGFEIHSGLAASDGSGVEEYGDPAESSAPWGGGMLNESVQRLIIQNCHFHANLAEAGGGAITNVDSRVYIRRSQFWFNEVRREGTDPGSERYYYYDPGDGGELELRNSILWAHGEDGGTRRIDPEEFDSVSYSDVELLPEQSSYSGPGNTSQDPEFYGPLDPADPYSWSWESLRIPSSHYCCNRVPVETAPLLDFIGIVRNGLDVVPGQLFYWWYREKV